MSSCWVLAGPGQLPASGSWVVSSPSSFPSVFMSNHQRKKSFSPHQRAGGSFSRENGLVCTQLEAFEIGVKEAGVGPSG